MMRSFNTEGQCLPEMHYMVNLGQRLAKIRTMIERQNYLYIQRGRQYGKTTLLWALEDYLKDDYAVIFLDFQKISNAKFRNEHTFSAAFVECLEEVVKTRAESVEGLDLDIVQQMFAHCAEEKYELTELFRDLQELCERSSKPIVMMIDEVDSATNNQVFLDFLALVRGNYLNRVKVKTFQSVILAGVYDIKNLKLKIRPESEHDKFNSPWNIAAKFTVDMNFSMKQIAGMLGDYEADHHTGMDIPSIAQIVYDYTSGYPYLVSALCKMLDEEVPDYEQFVDVDSVWTEEGVLAAVNELLKTDVPIFGSLSRQLEKYPDLKEMLRNILFRGQQIPFNAQIESVNIGLMFGYLAERNGMVWISNRIFEMQLQNMFIAEAASESEAYQFGARDKNQFIRGGKLDMDLVMEKFVRFYGDVFSDKDEKYLENFGREIFLMYLKPIINGTGNYYQESSTRTMTRTDVIVDYLGEQFVIECKIWHGQEYNRRGENQLIDYLDFYHKEKGYLLSFNFNKNKKVGISQLRIGEKLIVEAVV